MTDLKVDTTYIIFHDSHAGDVVIEEYQDAVIEYFDMWVSVTYRGRLSRRTATYRSDRIMSINEPERVSNE